MSLYNIVRPKALDEVVGNKSTIASLRTYLRKPPKERNHCFLFQGPTGCGKTTLARIMAQEVGTDPQSIFEINTADANGVDSIRQLNSTLHQKPLKGESKTYILDESHSFTGAAQQALLKPLEDYPQHVYIMFCTTNPEKLINTIKGRCITYEVAPLTPDEMTVLIKRTAKQIGFAISDPICEAIVLLTNGHSRNAICALENIYQLDDEETMLNLLISGTQDQPEIMDICRLLMMAPEMRCKKWQKALGIIDRLGQPPEEIRRAILGFMGNKLLTTTNMEAAEDYASIIRRFSHSTYNSGKPMLFALVYQACCGSVRND